MMRTRGIRRAGVVLAVVLAIAAGVARAAEPDATERQSAYAAAWAADRQAIATEQAATQAELADLRARRDALAAELVALELANSRLATSVAALATTAAELDAANAPVAAALQRSTDAGLGLASTIDVVLGDVPVAAAIRRSSDAAQAALRTAESPDTRVDQLTAVLASADALHALATTTSAHHQTIFPPDGAAVEATVVAVSLARFAASTTAGDAAIALGAPADATGFRWLTEPPPEVDTATTRGVAALASGAAAVIPMDVTGSLRLESWDRAEARTLAARLRQGGMLMWPLAVVACLAVILLLERFVAYLRAHSPAAMIDAALAASGAGDPAAAETALAVKPGGLAATLMLAALRARTLGQAGMEDSIETRMLEETPRLRKRLSGIAVLAAVAPLLGLLGTVTGIIQTFGVIESTGRTDPSLMAAGISQALVTTAAGLVVAIPILLLHRAMVGLMDGLVAEAEAKTAILLNALTREVPDGSGD